MVLINDGDGDNTVVKAVLFRSAGRIEERWGWWGWPGWGGCASQHFLGVIAMMGGGRDGGGWGEVGAGGGGYLGGGGAGGGGYLGG